MIPVLMNSMMEKDLLSYKDELCIPMPLEEDIGGYLSDGLIMIQGGCFYGCSDYYTDVHIPREDIEFTQWNDNHVHPDRFQEPNRIIGAWEVSQGMSLLIATYLKIRKNGFEGTYRFNLSYDQGEPFDSTDSGNCPSCTVRFYRDLGNPIPPFCVEELNKFKSDYILEFSADPTSEGEINAFVLLDNRWYLTDENQVTKAHTKTPSPRIVRFENVPWMANWTFVRDDDGISYAFINDDGMMRFRPNLDQGLKRFIVILTRTKEAARDLQLWVDLELDQSTIETMNHAFHTTTEDLRKVEDTITDFLDPIYYNFYKIQNVTWTDISVYTDKIRVFFRNCPEHQ